MGRRGARHDEGAFVVEGSGSIATASSAGWVVEAQFVAPGATAVPGVGGVVHELAPNVIERIGSTDAPQPVIAIVAMPAAPVDLEAVTFAIVADLVSDPGNLGTILRSAEAAGADAVVVSPGSVDLYNPKTVRASAGALFHVPVVSDLTLGELRRLAPRLTLLGTSSHRGDAYDSVDLRAPIGVVLGNEAHGLEPSAPVDRWVRIPHRGRAESLNVAMAATVVAFETARQRRAG